MKLRRVQLGVAIAATFAAPMAHALGLGPITVRSGLNEPLRAEIPLLEVSTDELAGIETRLATSSDFARVGLSASNVPVPLEFAVVTGASGAPAIAVTSREPVREPLVSVLIEVNWSNGRMLREYNILLDPPRVAPAITAPAPAPAPAVARPAATTAAAAPEPAAAPAEAVPAAPAPTPRPAATAPVATAPAPAVASPRPEPARPSSPPPAPPAAPAAERPGQVTVQSGDTLWEIAQANRPRPSTTVDQMMIALQRENPRAFIGGNINRIRRGATLTIPDAATVDAITPAVARAEVQAQVAALAAAPAASATPAGSAPAPATGTATARPAAGDSRLEVLPPRAGSDGRNAAGERSGAADGTDARRAAQLDADLKRAQEQVASREQEVRELRSRVTDLEKIDRDRQSLVTLKDSDLATLKQQLEARDAELARLAARVKELEAAEDATTTATGADLAAASAATVAPVQEAPATPAEPTPASPIEQTEAAVAAEPVAAVDSATTPPVTEGSESGAVESSFEDPAAAPASEAPAEPAVAETATPAPEVETAPAVATIPRATPWWQQPIVLAVAGAAALLLLIAGILSGRRRKAAAGVGAAVAARPSVAEAFQDSDDGETDEQRLLGYLATAPNDLDAHLDLLRVYGEQGDLERFETSANAMYAQVYDPMAPQWQDALALGRDLLPDHPLFADVGFLDSPTSALIDEPGDQAEQWESLDLNDAGNERAQSETSTSYTSAPVTVASSEPTLEIEPDGLHSWEGLDDVKAQAVEVRPFETVKGPDVSLDMDFDLEPVVPVGAEPGVVPFTEDSIGTKLDLARAYIDMGDIDGARSMLQEVVAEGAEVQKQEARRLLDSLG